MKERRKKEEKDQKETKEEGRRRRKKKKETRTCEAVSPFLLGLLKDDSPIRIRVKSKDQKCAVGESLLAGEDLLLLNEKETRKEKKK